MAHLGIYDNTHHHGYDDGGDDDWGDYYGYSNLGGDYTVKMSGNDIYMSITNYGDYYEVGCNNYWIDIYEDGNTGVGLYLSLDLLTNASADALAGTYTPSYDATSYEKVYVEGGIDEEGYLFGCWLLTLDGDSVDESGPLAPMYDGTISGVGPRYCPSIETKIVRFADKSRHQLFIEPCGLGNGVQLSQSAAD